jgi:hypothetical protein
MTRSRNSTAAIEQAMPVLRVPAALEALERALTVKNQDKVIAAAIALAEAVRRAVDIANADVAAARSGDDG